MGSSILHVDLVVVTAAVHNPPRLHGAAHGMATAACQIGMALIGSHAASLTHLRLVTHFEF
jgi:hypothetical protein